MTPDVTAPAPAAWLAKDTTAGQAPSDGLMPYVHSSVLCMRVEEASVMILRLLFKSMLRAFGGDRYEYANK